MALAVWTLGHRRAVFVHLRFGNGIVHIHLGRAEHLHRFSNECAVFILMRFFQAIQVLFHLFLQREGVNTFLELTEIRSEVWNHLVPDFVYLKQDSERTESVGLTALEDLGCLLHPWSGQQHVYLRNCASRQLNLRVVRIRQISIDALAYMFLTNRTPVWWYTYHFILYVL